MRRTGFRKKEYKPMKRSYLRRVSLNKIKKPKAHDSSWWQKKCDSLMQDINRLLFERCEVCGGKNEVAHHVMRKQLSSFLRYNFTNLAHICNSCHFAHHIREDPRILTKLIEIRGKEWYDWLESVRRTPQQTGIKYYQQIYKELSDKKALLYQQESI